MKQKQLSECEKCGRKSEVVMLGQDCPFCDKNALDKEIEAFEEKFPSISEDIETLHRPGTMHERFILSGRRKIDTAPIKSFLRQSLLRFARSVIEEAMPKERENDKEHKGINIQEHCESCIKNNGFNLFRTQLKENVERILKDNK